MPELKLLENLMGVSQVGVYWVFHWIKPVTFPESETSDPEKSSQIFA